MIRWIGKESVQLSPEETKDEEFFLAVKPEEVSTQKNKWKLECWSHGQKLGTENITFIAPHP